MSILIPKDQLPFENRYAFFIPLISLLMLQTLFLIPSWYVLYIHFQEGTLQTPWPLFSVFWISIDLLLMVYILQSIKSIHLSRRVFTIFACLTGLLWSYEIYSKLIQVLAHRRPMFYNDFFLINDALYLYADLFTSHWAILLLLTGLFCFILFKVFPQIWAVLDHTFKYSSTSISPFFQGIVVLAGIIIMHQFQHTRLEDAPAQLIAGRIRNNLERSLTLYRQVHDPGYRAELDKHINQSFEPVIFRPDIYLFVMESYGRILADRPYFREKYRPLMSNVNAVLENNGWNAVTNYSVAPVSGSGSWLSDASVLSGIHIDNQAIYDYITSTNSLPYIRFFRSNNYRTFALEPGSRSRPGLPVSDPYGFDTVLTLQDLTYHNAPFFGWGQIPDQYSLYMANSDWLENHTQPLFFYFPMVTSHAPWTDASIPPYIDSPTDSVQLISAYMNFHNQDTHGIDSHAIQGSVFQEHYFQAIAYDFEVIKNFLAQKDVGESIVIIVGDHQPPLIIGEGDSYQTPIHILSTHEELLRPFSRYGFTNGMYKNPNTGEIIEHHQIMQQLIDVIYMFNNAESG